ncbi:MAG: Undecaprenyl-phosphate mannosyltransferase [Candidatus Heimdallarchaeota archaeon LC_3]|nr:MAG: Undecaprenyl-phosphate mannosyltransferase [Candidatus Heimdallarchaeota archaeon LC_3]
MIEIFAERSIDAKILVIDDNSPDRTAEKVKEFMKKYSQLDLLFRTEKEGLGKAYIAGFQYAISKYDPEYIFEMDADLSHPPDVFPQMLEMLESGEADLVIGSRKIPGGGTENWGIHRKIISGGGNLYARIMLGISPKDVTSGYRGFRSSFLKQIDLESIDSGGYSFQIELVYLTANLLKAKTGEVPIVFIDRKHGKSKLGMFDIMEFFLEALRLAFFGWRRKKKLLVN